MKKIWTWYFDKWGRPLLFFIIMLACFIPSVLYQQPTLEITLLVLTVLTLIAVLASGLRLLIRRRWIPAVISFLTPMITITGLIIFVIAVVLEAAGDTSGDGYADKLKIPDNIVINDPVNLGFEHNRPDSITGLLKEKMDFQLYNGIQPGIFEYDCWLKNTGRGHVFLKAYEVTHNDALSVETLRSRSSITIDSAAGEHYTRYETTGDFTIYEGDWGKPYAARFEVWFDPADGGPERKLMEKVYKIEGWMR
ncbi:hypothetical protein F0L74_22820 [Chitinophaga agrisoli]|uniref:Uncharacterized protein n=1 Tax=Chitinophaga agrisoli TaxID=2607653 RepID=A0A5B2VLA9_9BACT|nr:hypothetical protein [Chitinophaga agrisoli]KAA2239047.1 hypothetical protein F0L74_22820 [Chitinophaga agrisoli]